MHPLSIQPTLRNSWCLFHEIAISPKRAPITETYKSLRRSTLKTHQVHSSRGKGEAWIGGSNLWYESLNCYWEPGRSNEGGHALVDCRMPGVPFEFITTSALHFKSGLPVDHGHLRRCIYMQVGVGAGEPVRSVEVRWPVQIQHWTLHILACNVVRNVQKGCCISPSCR